MDEKQILTILVLILALTGIFFADFLGIINIPGLGTTVTAYTNCNFGKLTVATIKCDLGGSETVTVDNIEQADWPTNADPTYYFYKFAESTITATSQRMKIINHDTGQTVCNYYNQQTNPCIGEVLQPKVTYEFKYCSGCVVPTGTGSVTLSRSTAWLYISDAFGRNEVQMPSTKDCISQNVIADIQETSASEYLVAGEDYPGSITLDIGQTETIPDVYLEIAPIQTYNYDGEPAICDLVNNQLTGFDEVTALDGSCWYVPNSAKVLFTSNNFCCVDVNCIELGVHAVCRNYECYADPSTAPPETHKLCQVQDDCGQISFSTDLDKKDYKITPQCVGGFCVDPIVQEIACNPLSSYGGDCCVLTSAGTYGLVPCAQVTDESGGIIRGFTDEDTSLLVIIIQIVIALILFIVVYKILNGGWVGVLGGLIAGVSAFFLVGIILQLINFVGIMGV